MTVKCECPLGKIKLFYSILQVAVNIRLYEYWQEQVKIRKKRLNNTEILLKINMQTES